MNLFKRNTFRIDNTYLYRIKHRKKDTSEMTKDELIDFVKESPYNLKQIENQTLEICEAAVFKDPYAIRYVKEQTREMCLFAVSYHGYYLQFIKNQTPEICLAAVSNTGWALEDVENKTLNICIAAVNENPYAIQFVDNKNIFDICYKFIMLNTEIDINDIEKYCKKFI